LCFILSKLRPIYKRNVGKFNANKHFYYKRQNNNFIRYVNDKANAFNI